MGLTLSDEERRVLGAFEETCGVAGRDCIVADDRVVILVSPDEMATAIGPGGQTVQAFEERIGRSVRLVADADLADDFVANALAPAAVYGVTISENDETVAYVEVADDDRGVAIGSNGRTIEEARRLAGRHFDIDDIQLA